MNKGDNDQNVIWDRNLTHRDRDRESFFLKNPDWPGNFDFPIEQSTTRRPREDEEDVETTYLEANIYYQVFAKFLKIHLTQLRNVSSYDIGKHSNIKLKVMVCNNTSGRKLTETSR